MRVGHLMEGGEEVQFLGQREGREWRLRKSGERMGVVLSQGGQSRIRRVKVSRSPGS